MKAIVKVPEFHLLRGTVVTTVQRNVLAFTSDEERPPPTERDEQFTPSPSEGIDTGNTGAVGPVSVNSPAERVRVTLWKYRHEVDVSADR